jgi:hypothetical protein
MIPDIFNVDILGISHERIDELMIFFLGGFGFLFFIRKEHQLTIQKKEKEREQRRLQQTAKDLIESYTYIGEINRKMDLLMQIGIGLSDRTNLTEKHEKEIYKSIIESAKLLLKSAGATLVFFNLQDKKIIKQICYDDKCGSLEQNTDIFSMEENIFVKHEKDFMVFCSNKTINNIKGYLIVRSFDEFQGQDNNNQEIMKYLVEQALILYAYITKNPVV